MTKGHPLADIMAGDQPSLYTMSADRPFLQDLAQLLLERYRDQPVALADMMIFLPTRRAARALHEAFLAAAGALPAATLLPRVRTLGDLGEEEALEPETALPVAEEALLPPVSALERRLVLAQMVYQSGQWREGEDGNWATTLHVADELAGLLDSFYTEQVPFDRIDDLVPAHYAGHWQASVRFLKIISEQWPAYLEAAGRLDPADHRRRLVDALAASWDPGCGGTPPSHPVLIAGSTGSMPAVARLMRLVSTLPQGAVILPGLDTKLDQEAWDEIEDPHPQAGLKYLLTEHFTDLPRRDIREWPQGKDAKSNPDRQRLLSLALRPAKVTDDWHDLLKQESGLEKAVENLSLIEAADEALEAQTIALALREALTYSGKRAILVTPDRVLARRVTTRLARWGIRLDDSGGVPFANTLRGNFLRLVADWLADVSDPLSLLTLLKHPLCNAGFPGADFTAMAERLDLALRGLRPGPGFEGLRARLMTGEEWDALTRGEGGEKENTQEDWETVRPLIDRLEEIAVEFLHAPPGMAELLASHLRVAEQLAATAGVEGRARLWAYEDGEAGAALMARLCEQAALLPAVPREDYAETFAGLISGTPVRPRGQSHPRLLILGPLEARLQQAELVILGGLNEGSWPDDSRTDPFLSRPMRKALGLPSHERRIGLSAHDFAGNASAPEVILSRAKRVGRSPAKPSRWVVRLKNILKAANLLARVDQTDRYESWARAMDAPDRIMAAAAPEPCPPLEARPDRLSVTAIERLLRDPYSIYASHILRLRRLDAIDLDPGFAVRGRFYHSLFARFALEFPDTMPVDPVRVLGEYASELFGKARLDEAVQAFWQVRMEESFGWFVRFHEAMLARGRPALIERRGSLQLQIGDRPFTLEARADRIDLGDAGAFVFDYKTGRIPSAKQVKLFSPQLQLTALMVGEGGFSELGPARPQGYAYLKVLNRKNAADIHGGDDQWLEGDAVAADITDARAALMEHLAHYNDPSTPYLSQPRAFYRNDYGDYDDLARRGEWGVDAGDSE